MSDLSNIQDTLKKAFFQEGQRIVFWHDPDKEFIILLETLELEGITTIRLDQESHLEVKIRIEKNEPDKKFLLYAPSEEPDYESDWLLDIKLYSRNFRADRASILLQDLGLTKQSLKSHLALRKKFFDSKDRLNKLKAIILPEDNETDIDRKMLSVVARADQPELFHLIHIFFHGWLDASVFDLEVSPTLWGQVEKLELDGAFWGMVENTFGYQEETVSLKKFLIRLLVTDFARKLGAEIPLGLKPLMLPEKGWQNAVVCLSHWRDSAIRFESYDMLSNEVANLIHLKNHLTHYSSEQLVRVHTFLEVEKHLASCVRDLITESEETIQIEPIRAIISQRQSGHWASSALADNKYAPRAGLHAVYDAFLAAAEFLLLWQENKNRLEFLTPLDLYRAYETELYKFDQLYRHFSEAANIAEASGWDIAKPTRTMIELHYVNGFLSSLSLSWGKFLEATDGLLNNWQLSSIPNQYRFYERNVASWIDARETAKAFIIISDAFRYEAAQELLGIINNKYRLGATLTSQLGVLPSYTALGMASLLPHKNMNYNGTEVIVDGISSIAANRGEILAKVGGVACKSSALMTMKKEEGRDFVRDKKVVYIYHDVVDATGDDSKTEGKTFEAVRQAIDELGNLISYLSNNLNAGYIIVTADHGFLYTETPPGETDRTKLSEKPSNSFITKKRYVLGNKLDAQDGVWKGKVRTTATVDDETEFLIPRGTNLFHFIGGARFIHGGAMPQEICVPVLTIKQVRDLIKPKVVAVQVLGTHHRITTGVCRFQLFQMEPVGEKLKPITLRIGIYEADKPVSDIQMVKFDSETSNLEERKKWVTFTLTGKSFDKKKPYRLTLIDVETGIEQQSVEIIIDRMVFDDF